MMGNFLELEFLVTDDEGNEFTIEIEVGNQFTTFEIVENQINFLI